MQNRLNIFFLADPSFAVEVSHVTLDVDQDRDLPPFSPL